MRAICILASLKLFQFSYTMLQTTPDFPASARMTSGDITSFQYCIGTVSTSEESQSMQSLATFCEDCLDNQELSVLPKETH